MKQLRSKAFIEEVQGKTLAVASEEVADRDGDVLTIAGWDLKNFKKNPTMLYLHMLDGDTMPIGNANNIRIEKIGGKDKLVFEPDFHEITEKAKTIKQMYEQGYLRAFSVGFQPKEWEVISESGEFPPRYKYTKQELLEISAVPIPALPTATIIERAKSTKMDLKVVKSILKEFEHAKDKQDEPKVTPPVVPTPEPKPPVVEEPVVPTPPVEEEKAIKRGRVLSGKNESKIKQAQGLLSEVLSALGEEDVKEDDKKDYVTMEEFKKQSDRVAHLISEIQKDRQERKDQPVQTDEEKALVLLAEMLDKAIEKAISKKNPNGDQQLPTGGE